MAVILPSHPLPRTTSPRYVGKGTRLNSALGGSTQNIARLGDRMAMDFVLPPMKEANARAWVAALMEAQSTGQTVRARVPQSGGPAGVVVSGVVNDTKANLNGAGVLEGMWFSFVAANGFSYLHMATSWLGPSTVRVSPRLRVNVNGAAFFDTPWIEGWLEPDHEWTVEVAQVVGLAFSITEGR